MRGPCRPRQISMPLPPVPQRQVSHGSGGGMVWGGEGGGGGAGGRSWPPPELKAQPRKAKTQPLPPLGTDQSEAQTWLFINKHTHAPAEPPGDPPERASSLAAPRSPSVGTANNASCHVPLIEAAPPAAGTLARLVTSQHSLPEASW